MDKEIGRIEKNSQVDIILKADAFGGKSGLTIREFSKSERYTGFTKSGTKIPVERFEEFKAMVNSIKPEDFPSPEESANLSEEKLKSFSRKTGGQASLPKEQIEEESEKSPEDISEEADY